MTHLTPDLLGFLAAWLPAPPARLLEIGCGDGALTRELLGRGFRVTAIDPDPPEGEPFVRSTLEEFEAEEPFDAAVAIRSLHHVGDLDAAIASLAAALRPGGRLVMAEFAVENFDEQAVRWLEAAGLSEHLDMHFDGVIPLAEVRRALAEVRRALGARFRELAAEPAPYLAREAGREALHEPEREAIASGELKPLGARLAYELSR
ncbi:MAG: class I SAM-dependent methyltransferase [Solirubrobacterales bacterium]